jgi:uncharacterized protein (TIGR02246 family)
MKRTFLVLAIALAAASAQALGGETATGAEVVLSQAWEKAMLAGDLAAVTALYAPDAVLYPPDAMEVKGLEAIRKSYADLFKDMKVLEARVTPARSETYGDTSIGWGTFTVKFAPKAGGEPVTMQGRYTDVAKKINGKWLYVADHASLPLPPPPAPAPAKK